MTPKTEEPIATSLAEHIPPMECDHRAALDLLLQTTAREMSDADFEALVRHYREKRRQDAAKRLERERAKAERNAKKAAIEARRAERLAPKPNPQGGGEGGGAVTTTGTGNGGS